MNKFYQDLDCLLKEYKDSKNKELYVYTCFYILDKINELIASESNYSYACYVKVRLIQRLNNKSLTYMLYQYICYYCPFIIPVQNYESIFENKDIVQKKKV